ncbi:sodium:calcium antiporter [Rhodovibrio sodomensis]|uniref:Sodium:calcium antiporter n=1 Tax=Rhodovibrio sodomensis TaxID=1088 RepID=A0ABS1DEH7_9PROT|nr:calcium/sodium antiporter [Rhodovibrio sodomensis]MBK1668609.1 sodium:calcium antiporter [Rhodovibrio sodomensis]
MTWLMLVIGLLLLVAGGDGLVRGSVALAQRAGISPLLIGLTLVGFGTSTPELLTSVGAALADSPGIAVGNVVGSNIANILLILGLAALIRPIAVAPAALKRDTTICLAVAGICALAVLYGTLNRPVGGVLLVLLVVYVVATYLLDRRGGGPVAALHASEAAAVAPRPQRLWLSAAMALGGLALTLAGAKLLVDAAVTLAGAAGVSETVIGLTIVAVGTSLPELITSLVAALRGQSDVAFGNVVGSNIFNVLGILGVTALVQPIPVPPEIASFDIWVMIAASVLLIVFAATGRRLSRGEGAASMAAYALYLIAVGGAI